MAAKTPAIPSVWARQRTRREQPALTQDRIVAEAIRLLDEEGIEALSMRSLGTRLGSAATSLYRHVANKDELIELVVDHIYGELDVPGTDDPGAWRNAVTRCAHSLREMVLRHPWVASVLGQVGLASLGPNLTRQSERMLALFRTAGLGPVEADQAMKSVLAYVIGVSVSEAAYLMLLARAGQTEQQFAENLKPLVERSVSDNARLREGHAARERSDPKVIREENFRYGLDLILDGLAGRLGPAS